MNDNGQTEVSNQKVRVNVKKPEMLVYATGITPRLKYTCTLILEQILGLKYQITADIDEFINAPMARICYNSRPVSGKECHVVPAGLMSERGINNHQVNAIDFQGTKALFPIYTRETCLPFDIFSAVFYMVTRYEEYLPFIRDEHGRFSSSHSLAKQKGFHQVPVVNVWVREFGKLLTGIYPNLKLKEHIFNFVPTIDIDAAWAFRHKGLYRSLGGFLKDLRVMDFDSIKRRYRSLLKLENDPFDTFEFMHSLHKKYGLRPHFFILFAGYGEFDKNTPVNNIPFQELIKSLGDEGDVGIHPSYASYRNDQILQSEIIGLSRVLHREVTSSRQHFLKLHMPDTYRSLISQDISDDYTMGYASEPGFRAGICMPFRWYDLEMERSTDLTIHPFMVMDGTLRDYMKIEAEGSMQIIRPLIDTVREFGGTFISLFHNESLSEWRRWKGWTSVYEEMLEYGTR